MKELDTAARISGLRWRLMAATFVERYASLSPDVEPWEQAFLDVQDLISAEMPELLPPGTHFTPTPEYYAKHRAGLANLPYELASRTTEADIKNEERSPDRKLTEDLYFIVKKRRKAHQWYIPAAEHIKGETLKETAERAVEESIGESVTIQYYGNAPSGYTSFEYSDEDKKELNAFGAKVFFFKAEYIKTDVDRLKRELRKSGHSDYKWVSREDLLNIFEDKVYGKLLYMIA